MHAHTHSRTLKFLFFSSCLFFFYLVLLSLFTYQFCQMCSNKIKIYYCFACHMTHSFIATRLASSVAYQKQKLTVKDLFRPFHQLWLLLVVTIISKSRQRCEFQDRADAKPTSPLCTALNEPPYEGNPTITRYSPFSLILAYCPCILAIDTRIIISFNLF